MPQNEKLRGSMTLADFDHGYWYATEIKAFAKSIGIFGVSTLRKDELEDLIRHFLRTGKVTHSKRERRTRGGIRDSERGLRPGLQVNLGLYGALLVVDSGRYDPEHERLILLGGNAPGGRSPRINGKNVPDTLRLRAGETYRLRLIHLIPDWTARIALLRGDSVLSWRALAKDGAELLPHRQTVRPADLIAGPGETMDFEYRPPMPGLLRLLVMQRTGVWRTELPLRAEP
jgi:hypothetical protein